MSMDLVLAVRHAQFGQPEVRHGIIPGVGGTQLLPRLIPRGAAMQMLLTGQPISADEARRLGLVNRVLADRAELLAACFEIAAAICRVSPVAVHEAKRAVRLGLGLPLEAALDVELACYERTVAHPDREEGVRAFLERPAPDYATPD